jgi:hypothetical protein
MACLSANLSRVPCTQSCVPQNEQEASGLSLIRCSKIILVEPITSRSALRQVSAQSPAKRVSPARLGRGRLRAGSSWAFISIPTPPLDASAARAARAAPQVLARTYRLGQDKETEVVSLVPRGTLHELKHQRCAPPPARRRDARAGMAAGGTQHGSAAAAGAWLAQMQR